MYIAIPRTRMITREDFGVWDVVKDAGGGYLTFDNLEDAQQYASENELETKHPSYLIVDLVGW